MPHDSIASRLHGYKATRLQGYTCFGQQGYTFQRMQLQSLDAPRQMYKKLSVKYHPDKNPESAGHFNQIRPGESASS